MAKFVKILDGKFNYTKSGQAYSEEVFEVCREDIEQGRYMYTAENLSRAHTGEFLKVQVDYILNAKFSPLSVEIKRSMGDKTSVECFKHETESRILHYTFTHGDKKHTYERTVSNVFHVATPCFTTMMLMSLMKKLDPVHRNEYSIVTSRNTWSYDHPFQEETIFLELQGLDPVHINIGEKELKTTHCKILGVDENGKVETEGQNIYMSKHFGIAYRGVFADDIVIEIETLKNYEERFLQTL